MAELDFDNAPRNDGVMNSQDDHRNYSNTPKHTPGLFSDERVSCRCGAKKYVDKYRRELDRKSHALERDRQYCRQRQEELDAKHTKLMELLNQHASQQEELDTYKMFLLDRQSKISRMYKNFEQAHADFMQKVDEFLLMEKDCKKKMAEYEAGMQEMKQRELMMSETTGALCARKEELERLENTMLQQSEKIKFMQEQCATTREKMQAELRQHNQRILEENEDIEARKKKLIEKENLLRNEKDKVDDSLRLKAFDLDRKLKEATEFVESNSKLAEQLKRKDEAIKKEKEQLESEWAKLKEAADQLNDARNEVKSIRRDLSMKSKQLELSQSQPDMTNNYVSNLNEARLKHMENELNRRNESLKQTHQELNERQEELNEMASQLSKRELQVKTKEAELENLERSLNKRRLELDEREKQLNTMRRELERRTSDLEHKKDKYRQLEAQFNEYKDRVALFSIERNSLDGQIEQLNAKKMNNQKQVNAINQRLAMKEKQISEASQLRGKGHSDLLNKLNSVKGSTFRPFSIADDQALN